MSYSKRTYKESLKEQERANLGSGNYGQPNFSKLLDECNQLNLNFQRSQLILTSNKDGRSAEGPSTSDQRLYSLHYGRSLVTKQNAMSIDQLHSQLIREREQRVMDQSHDESKSIDQSI